MILENNPVTVHLHNNWRQRIIEKFPETDFSKNSDYLCLISYLDNAPQKFYSKEAFEQYLLFLENTKKKDPNLLSDILIEAEPLLSISNKILTEVNKESIHDIFFPKDHNALINFIDKDIHYNLLKLYETPFFQLCHIVAKYSWLKDKKSIDGLDLFNSIKQIIKIGFPFVEPIYLHDVRNGIAHGKIIFSDHDITYIDKKGNKVKISTKKIIDTFDSTLDITNGFCLAFKVFCLTNPDFLETNNIPIPQSILLEELKARANAPGWSITNCLESFVLVEKKQLQIYIKNDNWAFDKVQWYSFTTAYWAEKLTKSYDRIFISLSSTHSKHTPSGWAAFDGNKLRELRERNEMIIDSYKGVLENDLIFFVPSIKFPKIIYKIGTIRSIIKTNFPIAWRNYIDTFFHQSPFYIRETQMHSKKSFSVIVDPSVIIKPDFQNNIEQVIRNNKKKIINRTIKYSRKQCSMFSLTRYLPVKYIRVFIYDTDKRVRNLRSSGLISELVASIEVNTTKRIKTIDIIGGSIEQHGKYRIVWNKYWKNKTAFDEDF